MNQPDPTNPARRRGRPPKSVSLVSYGEQEAPTPPLETSTADVTPVISVTSPTPSETVEQPAPPSPTPPVDSGAVSDALSGSIESPVMERLRQKAEQESQTGAGATKGPHPYEYQIQDRAMVPGAYRDNNYDIDHDRIHAALQDAWQHERNPIIPGIMIGVRRL